MTQAQMAQLFGKSVKTVNEHVKKEDGQEGGNANQHHEHAKHADGAAPATA